MLRSIRLKDDAFRAHKMTNARQTVLLFGGMLVFVGLIGYLIAGLAGVVWALLLGVVSFAVGQRLGPLMVLRMYHARHLFPGEAPALYQIVQVLAIRAELADLPQLYYVPSAMLNAFAVNVNGIPAIGVTDGLLRTLNTRELSCVLAHEIGHIRNRDLTVMGLADVVSRLTHSFSMVGQALLLVSLPMLWTNAVPIPWLLIALLLGAPMLSALLQMALSRTREFDADLEAVRLTGDPEAFMDALAKIELQGVGWFERIFLPGRRVPAPSLLRTHPDTAERIERIRSLIEVYTPQLSLQDLAQLLPVRLLRVERSPRWRFGGLWY